MTSPNYPLDYPRNLRCHWILYSDISADQYIQVRFLEFDIAEEWDFLTIGYSDIVNAESRIGQFTGPQAPSYVIVRQSIGWISFDSHPLDFYFKRFFLQLGVLQNNGTYILWFMSLRDL